MENEKRLIDMEDALRRMETAEHLMHSINGIKAVDVGAVRQFFGMLKPVDAVEVVLGRWVEVYEKLWNLERPIVAGWECSVCGVCGYSEYNYCPNCGAKMDLKGE